MFEVSNAKRQSPGFPVWVPRVGDFRLFWDALGCSWLILVKLGQVVVGHIGLASDRDEGGGRGPLW